MQIMDYPEVTKVNGDCEAAYESIKALGYQYLDGGNFARVYVKGNRVVKIGLVNADNYIHFVRMVGLETNNPHLPYIHSIRIYDAAPDTEHSAPYYVVEMEKLSEGSQTEDYWMETLGTKNPGALLHEAQIKKAKPKTEAMKAVVTILKNLYNDFDARCDIGGGLVTANVMFRGTTAVFTDPVV